MEEIVKTITESVTQWIQSLGSGFISYVVDNIDNFNHRYEFGSLGPDLFRPIRYTWLWSLYRRVLFFSWMVLLLRLAVDGVRTYLARETGEMMISPMIIFRRLVVTVVLMALSTYAFAYGHHGISSTMGRLIKFQAEHVSKLEASRKSMVYDQDKWYPDMGPWLTDFKQEWIDAHAGAGAGNPGEAIFRMTIALTITVGILTFFVQQALRELELVFAWLVGPVACLSAMTTDEPWREGAFSLWLREVIVVSFNQVSTMVILIMLYETIDLRNLSQPGVSWRTVVGILALIAIGTQGPRALRHYAWGNQQGQMLASQLIRMPW